MEAPAMQDVVRSPGIFLIDKPAGISSAHAIAQVKRRLRVEKIGHAGTLDPFATGLLIVLANGATRCMEYCLGGEKKYSGIIKLGARSSSDDRTGELVPSDVLLPRVAQVAHCATQFVGTIAQVPPQISAVHIHGERAYERVRRGERVEIAPRQVSVFEFSLTLHSDAEYRFVVRCSSGTYIRALARDLGELLGCGGYLQELRREGSAPFSVSAARLPDHVVRTDLLPLAVLFPEAPRFEVYREERNALRNGHLPRMVLATRPCEECFAVLCEQDSGAEVALLRYRENRWGFVWNSNA